jgi:hypothetical protein
MNLHLNIDQFLNFAEIISFLKNSAIYCKKNKTLALNVHFYSNNEDFFSSKKIIENFDLNIQSINYISTKYSLNLLIYIHTILPKKAPLNVIYSRLQKFKFIKVIYHQLNLNYYLDIKLYNINEISKLIKIDNFYYSTEKDEFKILDYIH